MYIMDIIDYQYIKQYCGCKTKLQNSYPYDSFLLGINNIYHTIGDDQYFINSPCIIAQGNIVQEGRLYLLQQSQKKSLEAIKFLEAYYHQDNVHLIVKDILNSLIKVVKCPILSSGKDCSWKLIDIGYLCETIGDAERLKPKSKSNINEDSDFLKFDFD